MPEAPPGKPRAHPARCNSLPLGEGGERREPCEGGREVVGGPLRHDDPASPRPSPLSAGEGAEPAAYVELQVATNFTFLTGASHPDEYVQQAAQLGYPAVGVTDVNTLAGIVRAHVAAKQCDVQLVVGCRLMFTDAETQRQSDEVRSDAMPVTSSLRLCVSASLSVLVFPTSINAYGNLCQLLTRGKRRAPKGECHLTFHDLFEYHEGLLAVVLPPPVLDDRFIDTLRGLQHVLDPATDRLSLAMHRLYEQDDDLRCRQIADLGDHLNIPLVATNDVHYHTPDRRPLQDVLTCIRHGCTIHEAGLRLFPNAERCLKAPDEMQRLFIDYPQALQRSVDIADQCRGFNLDQLRCQYPEETCPDSMTPIEYLRTLTWEGARTRLADVANLRDEETRRQRDEVKGAEPQRTSSLRLSVSLSLDDDSVSPSLLAQIEHEFALIEELNYARYFLTVHDLVVFARSRGILCQGRGAAANSAVCYCLGITNVDPTRVDLLFERFISRERNEPPDIDIDFEHERREEVIQYIYRKYGRDRAALTAEVISYRGRSAIRDVGKALGLSLDTIDRIAKNLDWFDNSIASEQRLREIGVNPKDPTVQLLVQLANEILGFPRHLSQHVGGFVITQRPLCELVPIENAVMEDRTVIEWDKDDIDAMGMLKVDCLGLGMMTCISKCLSMINACSGISAPRSLQLHTIPPEDPAVYDMCCRADTVGVFQIESRAQMSMLPRLKPRCYYDLVIEVAIVRPGPIQGNMVHPYLRRRNGEEEPHYPNAEIEKVLGKTLGVPLFQEQAMALSIVAAGFTPGQADDLRRAMAAWGRKGRIVEGFGEKIYAGMVRNGYSAEYAKQTFEQIKGFGEYGFPESHAASFALLVYTSAWLKRHHPAAFAASLINSQPMGFYAPAQIIRDAKEHSVEVRPVDVNFSGWDCCLESRDAETQRRSDEVGGEPALRLGMRLVKGLKQDDAQAILDAVQQHGRFHNIADLYRASGVSAAAMKRLASADAFQSMGLDRQQSLWEVRQLRDEKLPLFDERRPTSSLRHSVSPSLPPVSDWRKVVHDYANVGLSLKEHPLAFMRDRLDGLGVTPSVELRAEHLCPNGMPISVAGIVLVRQRPGTASGVVFMTLEDETGVANLIVRPRIFERYRKAARHSVVMLARGTIERQGEVVHVMVRSLHDLGADGSNLPDVKARNFH